MDKSRQQFEDWRSKNKSSTINLFDVWQASRESLINNLEPICFGIINEEDGKLFLDRAKNKKERAIYHRDILSKYSLGKKLTISPLYRLD
ncbi:hypothetical protein [Providencia heimbachae]|uniref:hypothetical protein n=1 Tax=Providencia heimbachae TaxID=333962 RepID=UPI0008388798